MIKNYESGHAQVQVVTTVVQEQRSLTGSKIYYEALVIHPA